MVCCVPVSRPGAGCWEPGLDLPPAQLGPAQSTGQEGKLQNREPSLWEWSPRMLQEGNMHQCCTANTSACDPLSPSRRPGYIGPLLPSPALVQDRKNKCLRN